MRFCLDLLASQLLAMLTKLKYILYIRAYRNHDLLAFLRRLQAVSKRSNTDLKLLKLA